jgi:hypothetical protein
MHLPSIFNLNGCDMIKLTLPHSNLTSLHFTPKPYAHVPRAQLGYIVLKKTYGLIRNESR